MRLLSKFLLVSIAGLTVMVAVLAGIGVTTIDEVLYQNSLHVLRAEIGSVARTLETKRTGPYSLIKFCRKHCAIKCAELAQAIRVALETARA